MPPRLLGDTSKYGACHEQQVEDCHGYGVVDTLAEFGGLWSFDKGAVAEGVEPVRGHAVDAHRLVDVVRARAHPDDCAGAG